MNIDKKQAIAAVARNLIKLLENCDDKEFVELVLNCVADGNTFLLEPHMLR